MVQNSNKYIRTRDDFFPRQEKKIKYTLQQARDKVLELFPDYYELSNLRKDFAIRDSGFWVQKNRLKKYLKETEYQQQYGWEI